ncbi:MAG: hypothetical protein ABSF63_13955 [Candidatus Bathyarchaeia archaeon]|jgi:hypothetical protein
MRRISWPLFVLGVLVLVISSTGLPFASAQSRMLYGMVYSATTGGPLAATIKLSRCFNAQTTTTTLDGSWQLSYPYGTLGTITFSAAGYASQSFQVNLNAQWYDAGGVVSLRPS